MTKCWMNSWQQIRELDQIKKAGKAKEPSRAAEQARRVGGCHCLHSPHVDRVARSSIQVLWPTCKITMESSQLHCLEPFPSKQRKQDKEDYIIIKESIQEEVVTIVDIYTPNCIKELLMNIKEEIYSNTIVVEDFNTPLTSMVKSSDRKLIVK